MQKPVKLKYGYRPLPKDKPLTSGWQPKVKYPSNMIVPPDPPKKRSIKK